MREVLEITGRSRRTIEKWVKNGHLSKYEQDNPRTVLFNEDDVVEAETERAAAARENRERIRRRGGRPGPRAPQTAARLDGNRSGDASLA
jgi:predicted DNA-binding transcriptional regulator AlpA